MSIIFTVFSDSVLKIQIFIFLNCVGTRQRSTLMRMRHSNNDVYFNVIVCICVNVLLHHRDISMHICIEHLTNYINLTI